MKRIHFIAVGGAAMHNIAIALKRKGYNISGSDDEIFEPSRSQLEKHGLLPAHLGWDASKVSEETDAVILGMHARPDNPELLKAQELGIKIYSYPEFLYEQTKNKTRVVIAGSHGKTTITAIIVHVLHYHKKMIDFMAGSKIEGMDTMVSLSDTSEIAVFEGDEYLSSPIDHRPKFIHYRPHIALISGIAWDHINVFPTFHQYVEQFENLLRLIPQGGHFVYCGDDENVKKLVEHVPGGIQIHPYTEHKNKKRGDAAFIVTPEDEEIPVNIFGRHNMQNISGAKRVCSILGIPDKDFYEAVTSFPGTARRLQVLEQQGSYISYIDFAHSPSKVHATLHAVREQFPDRKIYAVLELHTFSSLNKAYIPHYSGTLNSADEAVVFFDEAVIRHKKLETLSKEFLVKSFARPDLNVFCEKDELRHYLKNINRQNTVLLLMSSGNFSGITLS